MEEDARVNHLKRIAEQGWIDGVEAGRQEGLEEARKEARQKARQEGIQTGVIIGQIQFLQEMLGLPVSSLSEFTSADTASLTALYEELRSRLNHR